MPKGETKRALKVFT